MLVFAALLAVPYAYAQKKGSAKPDPKADAKAAQAASKPVVRPKYAIVVTTQSGRTLGSITLELFPDVAPKHAANFDSLVRSGFYNGTAFHRVMKGFMIQGGDPNSKSKSKETWGAGDPSQTRVPAEFNTIPHKRGILSAARTSDPNSATSQFFICHGDAPALDGKYTVFGQVVSGLEVVDSVCAQPMEFSNTGEFSSPKEKIEMTIVPKSQYVISVTHAGKRLGDITIETLPEVAPKHVANFDSLVAAKSYDSTAFHRVVPGFMIQGGDLGSKPRLNEKAVWGMGLPGQKTIPAEFSKLSHRRGMISAARTNDPNSATSQFFICHGDPTFLDGQYTIWAQVLSGMEVVDKIAAVPCDMGGDGAVSAPRDKVEVVIRKK
jgi:peptidyl-prolyl cis-trans isomerase B (cyclophilin B)